eukprot:PhM_4_TR15927/c0_g1_i1/m.43481
MLFGIDGWGRGGCHFNGGVGLGRGAGELNCAVFEDDRVLVCRVRVPFNVLLAVLALKERSDAVNARGGVERACDAHGEENQRCAKNVEHGNRGEDRIGFDVSAVSVCHSEDNKRDDNGRGSNHGEHDGTEDKERAVEHHFLTTNLADLLLDLMLPAHELDDTDALEVLGDGADALVCDAGAGGAVPENGRGDATLEWDEKEHDDDGQEACPADEEVQGNQRGDDGEDGDPRRLQEHADLVELEHVGTVHLGHNAGETVATFEPGGLLVQRDRERSTHGAACLRGEELLCVVAVRRHDHC